MIRLLEGRATGRDWCDDRTTPEREKCSDMLARALGTGAGGSRKALRQGSQQVALGHGALRRRRAPAVQQGARCWRPISRSRCRAPAAPTRSTAARPTSARSTAVRQPARLEPARHLRLRRSRPLAVHAEHRAVGQPDVAVLPLVRQALVRGRLHRDPDQARDDRQKRHRHLEAVATVEVLLSPELVEGRMSPAMPCFDELSTG